MLFLHRTTKAFTLLELIVVIVIFGILAAIAIPTFNQVIDKTYDAKAQTQLAALAKETLALAVFDQVGGLTKEQLTAAIDDFPERASAASVGVFASSGANTRPNGWALLPGESSPAGPTQFAAAFDNGTLETINNAAGTRAAVVTRSVSGKLFAVLIEYGNSTFKVHPVPENAPPTKILEDPEVLGKVDTDAPTPDPTTPSPDPTTPGPDPTTPDPDPTTDPEPDPDSPVKCVADPTQLHCSWDNNPVGGPFTVTIGDTPHTVTTPYITIPNPAPGPLAVKVTSSTGGTETSESTNVRVPAPDSGSPLATVYMDRYGKVVLRAWDGNAGVTSYRFEALVFSPSTQTWRVGLDRSVDAVNGVAELVLQETVGGTTYMAQVTAYHGTTKGETFLSHNEVLAMRYTGGFQNMPLPVHGESYWYGAGGGLPSTIDIQTLCMDGTTLYRHGWAANIGNYGNLSVTNPHMWCSSTKPTATLLGVRVFRANSGIHLGTVGEWPSNW